MNELRQALDNLIAVMLEKGMPHQDWLLPGLHPDEVRGTLTQAGYPITEEIVTWFSWHNGASRNPDPNVYLHGAFLGGFLLSLDEAIAEARDNYELSRSLARDDGLRDLAEIPWDSGWMPILDNEMAGIAVDLSTDPVVCPVIDHRWDSSPSEWNTMPSLQALIDVHTALIREEAI